MVPGSEAPRVLWGKAEVHPGPLQQGTSIPIPNGALMLPWNVTVKDHIVVVPAPCTESPPPLVLSLDSCWEPQHGDGWRDEKAALFIAEETGLSPKAPQ